MPETLNVSDLERELTSCLGLVKSIIIPSTQMGKSNNFFAAAARHVTSCLEYCVNIGLGWGRTVYNISKHLAYQSGENKVVFYPLVGCSGDDNPYLQINSITDRFAEHYHARARYLNLPVFRKDDQLTAEEEQRLTVFQNKWGRLDGAVVGIGEFNSEDRIYIDEVSYDPYLLEHKYEIVGDVLAHLLLQDGRELFLPGYSHIACSLENLTRMPEVIGVARGVWKTDAIYHVARGKYIKTLITDDITAKSILSKYGFKENIVKP